MAALHEAGVKGFLAGGQTPTQEPAAEAHDRRTTKVFTLTTGSQWEVSKGQFVNAMAFDEQIPAAIAWIRGPGRVRPRGPSRNDRRCTSTG